MKKVLMSLFTIAIVGTLIGGGVIAFFSDVEEAPGTFTAGTIDIAIDDENPWEATFAIEQAKPSQTWYQTYEITNVGNNPCVVYKHLKDPVTGGGIVAYEGASSEPEYVAGGGKFNGVPNGGYAETCDIDNWILYDLYAEIIDPVPAPGTDLWHQTLYDENIVIGKLWSEPVILGSIPVGGKMKVIESYHLKYATPNDYQGDTLSFTIAFEAQQLEGTTVLLENKLAPLYAGGPALVQFGDGKKGELTYNTVGSKFDYTFWAKGLDAGEQYGLIYYADPWNVQNPTTLIATFTAVGGNIGSKATPEVGSIDLGMDLPAATDANVFLGAKIWLVRSAYYSPSSAAPGDSVTYTDWGNLYKCLLDTHLIWYNDTDEP
jgi:predicted ribosomally synthesized peptide with SipW-like signal peptide